MEYGLVAEGNANTILRRPDGSLIRVSKRNVDPARVAEYWNQFWRPKLGKYMGEMECIVDAKYGCALLIEEVGNELNQKKLVAQFKPKWLVQSPCAPPDACCCRTCAIKTMRNQPLTWCSLDVAAKDPKYIALLVNSVTKEESHRSGVRRMLLELDLIDMLLYWQTKLADEIEHAMSLRDCSILVEYDLVSNIYQAKIVDLDPKSGTEKHAKWAEIEKDLEPFYLMSSPVCRLSR